MGTSKTKWGTEIYCLQEVFFLVNRGSKDLPKALINLGINLKKFEVVRQLAIRSIVKRETAQIKDLKFPNLS